MPLPVAHGLLGASIVAALNPQPARRGDAIPLVVGAFFANAADLDFLLVVAFDSKSWHRGPTHSLLFTLIPFIVTLLLLGKDRLKESIAYGLAFGSHGILDYLTSKYGGGVELWWPISTERIRLGWWGLSELPSRLPTSGVVQALIVEFALFTPLLLGVMLLRNWLRVPGSNRMS